MSEAHIIGVGMVPFGRTDRSYEDIGAEAARLALQDSGLQWNQMQAAYMSRMYLPATSGLRTLRRLGSTNASVIDVEAACASGGAALAQAKLAIESGALDLVLVLGVEKMPRGFLDPTMIYQPWQIEMGMSQNPAYWSMRARRHMYEFGTTEEQIAKVAWKNHRNSVNNPYAMYRKEFSMDEILSSRLVCDPIRLLEVCAPNDGAAAIIVASAEAVKKYGLESQSVKVAACVHTVASYSSDFRCPIDSMSAKMTNPGPSVVAAGRAYEQAGVGPGEIDCFEVQDTDAFCEIELYEELGLCGLGEGGVLVDNGHTTMGGKQPVNMSGGLISKGEPVGASHLGQIVELTWQLRGTADARQVEGARTALGHVLGAGGNCAVTILTR